MGSILSTGKDFAKGQAENAGLIKPDAQTNDPEAFHELYDAALKNLQGVGNDPASLAQRDSYNKALQSQFDSLDNNAAGRKANFMEDQSRGFAADTQNLARAKGGTGTLAQALNPSGGMYDAQARATSRGLNDLTEQATQDLGTLGGAYSNLQGVDQNKANSIANTYQNELNSRRGTASQNSDAEWNANVQQQKAHAGTLQAVGSIAGMAAGSDESLKENIEPGEEELMEFLDNLAAYKYNYKDPAFGAGNYVSVMAQDLEKSKIGRSLVTDTPHGKFVDYAKAFGALLAAQVSLNNRLKKLEA